VSENHQARSAPSDVAASDLPGRRLAWRPDRLPKYIHDARRCTVRFPEEPKLRRLGRSLDPWRWQYAATWLS